MRAVVDRSSGRTSLAEVRGQAPIGVYPGAPRPDGGAVVWLVGSAGGPIGGDQTDLTLEVGDGAALVVGSVAASIALAARGSRSVSRINAMVGAGATLVWAPQPLVITARADHVVEIRIDVDGGGGLWWREEIVLGRSGEEPGRGLMSLSATWGGRPWARHAICVGGPGWDGPAGLAGARVVGSVLSSDPAVPLHSSGGARSRAFALDLAGTLVTAIGDDRLAVAAALGPGPL